MSTCINGSHNEFNGFDSVNQGLKAQAWDPFFKKVDAIPVVVEIYKRLWDLYATREARCTLLV